MIYLSYLSPTQLVHHTMTVNSLFVCLSVCHPFGLCSVHLRSFVWSISSIPSAQSGSYFTNRLPLGKGCAVTFNQFFRSKVKGLTELHEKPLPRSYNLSFCFNLAYTSATECLCALALNDVFGSKVKVMLDHAKKKFRPNKLSL